jgi:predicted PurR-regulated permease PerM
MAEWLGGSNRWLKAWLLLPLVALNGWVLIQLLNYFEPLVTILVIAAILAFVLDYPVEFLQQRRLPRPLAVLLVLLVSLIGLVLLGITILPTLLEQLSGILTQLPDWLNAASDRLQAIQTWATTHRLPINLNRLIRQITARLPAELEGLGDETLTLALNAVGGLSSLLLTLVLTLYFLLDGKRVWRTIFKYLPLQNSDHIRQSLQRDFDRYFIGQAALGLITGVLISTLFVILHVPYSLLLGSTIGVLSLIPFGDTIGYIVVCLFLATQSPGLAIVTLGAAVVIDQILDQAIAPNILGGLTGLQPIWIIVSILLGTKLFGFPGLLLAVPIASSINSLMNDEELEPNPTSSTNPISPLATHPEPPKNGAATPEKEGIA